MLFVLIFLVMCPGVSAGEGLFNLSMVDYFGMRASLKENAEPGYRPPQVVMDLLEYPDEQTALAYLRWQRERLEKISRAQDILDKVMAYGENYGDMYKIQ